MVLPDYHIHTSYSPDSKMDPEEAVRAAIASGITNLCFTEYMDLGHHMEMYDRVPDFAEMEETISRLREKYSEINIGKGIEVGYIPASVIDDRLTEYYDCISHIGYIAKGLHYEDNTFPYEMFPELFDKILSEIIKRGKGIEVNTSGIDRGGHVLPHPSIIRRYRELGGRIITIGSDAHKSQNVGAYIKEAVKIINEAGFEEITLFQKREPRFVRIDSE